MKKKMAHVIIDFQNDFVDEKGSLTTNAASVGKTISEIMQMCSKSGISNIATQDWHPENHISFASTHGEEPKYHNESRPDHCVANSWGSELHNSLEQQPDILFKKGKNEMKEEYSAFANGYFANILREMGIDTIFISGVATDYCVKFTALDSIKEGFTTYVISDAIKSVAKDASDSINEMNDNQIKSITSEELSFLLKS